MQDARHAQAQKAIEEDIQELENTHSARLEQIAKLEHQLKEDA